MSESAPSENALSETGPSEVPQGGALLSDQEIFALERPQDGLLIYYAAGSLLLGPLFFLALIPLYFRYRTMRYRFDEEGVSMRWGILFRREINLTYARIQDIHLVSNAVERWLGLARIKIQTASASAKAEMTIEGIGEYAALRDFLYSRMRGTRGQTTNRNSVETSTLEAVPTAELTATLRSVAEELKHLRLALERQANEATNEASFTDPSTAGDDDA